MRFLATRLIALVGGWSAFACGAQPQGPAQVQPRTAPAPTPAKRTRRRPRLPEPLPPFRLNMAHEYRQPPPGVVELLTAPDPPEPKVHTGSKQVALLYRQELIPLERLASPFLGLAGFRFDPVTRTSRGEPPIERLEVVSTNGAPMREWKPAEGALLDDVQFSPDGKHLSAIRIVAGAPAQLAVFDVAKKRSRVLPVPILAAWGAPCDWLGPDELLCRVVPDEQGSPPPTKPGPNILEHPGGRAPARTYSNLLTDAHDDELFEFYFTAELARVRLDGNVRRLPGTRGLLQSVDVSPGGRYAVLTRLKRPYSRFVPADRFPRDIEIWDVRAAARLRQLELPHEGAQPTRGAPEGPREFAWKPGPHATLGWLTRGADGHGRQVDRWMALDPPFDVAPRQIARSDVTIWRFGWTTAGTPYYMTHTDGGTQAQAYVLTGGVVRRLWEGSTDPGAQAGRALRTDGEQGAIVESDGHVFLTGDGQAADGPQPFLDALDVKTLQTSRLHTSPPGYFEQPIAVFDGDPRTWLVWRQSPTEPPSLRRISGDEAATLWQLDNPYPQLAGVSRQLIEYQRADGVRLFGTLYLPPGYSGEGRLPALLWIYPSEHTEQQYAELPPQKSHEFAHVKGPSPLSVLLAGYALLYNPTVPIIGDKRTANDDYLSQLVASAEAAVEKITEMGVADPDRIAVAGRSYGAFSTANLLIHSSLFRTGIAISGAYNRTLTPFGFQAEQRSFWGAPEMYAEISPFFHADGIQAPILLIHGAADENPGTQPMQSERFFHALVGNGAPVRYVTLPHEGHQYYAKESVLHLVAEIIDWLDRTM